MDLLGLMKAGMEEIDKAKRELGVKIEKCSRGAATFTVVFGQVLSVNPIICFVMCNIIRVPMTRRRRLCPRR